MVGTRGSFSCLYTKYIQYRLGNWLSPSPTRSPFFFVFPIISADSLHLLVNHGFDGISFFGLRKKKKTRQRTGYESFETTVRRQRRLSCSRVVVCIIARTDDKTAAEGCDTRSVDGCSGGKGWYSGGQEKEGTGRLNSYLQEFDAEGAL